MLKPIKRERARVVDGRFVIVASRYNARYVDAMVRAAKAELSRARAAQVQVIRVPGAFEIPIVAARLASTHHGARITNHESRNTEHGARSTEHASQGPLPVGGTSSSPPLSAIICLGVILRGETSHAAHIGEAVTRALMEIQLRYEVPVIHEVLLLESKEQARARCLDRRHNRGAEAAQTALAMAEAMKFFARPQ